MLSMDMMNAFVAYQMNDSEAPLPSKEELINRAKAIIANREKRINELESVANMLKQRADMSVATLESLMTHVLSDDPMAAVQPQLENIRRSVTTIEEINRNLLKTLELSNEQFNQKIQLNIELRESLSNLQQKLKSQKNSQTVSFLNECSVRASYAAAGNNLGYKE